MRVNTFLLWFFSLALLIAWPELRSALLDTLVWAVQEPGAWLAGVVVTAVYRALHRVQEQAARGWAS